MNAIGELPSIREIRSHEQRREYNPTRKIEQAIVADQSSSSFAASVAGQSTS